MTFYTDRNNVQPMFFGIAIVVVIILCLCWTVVALQGIGPRQFAISDSVINSIVSFSASRVSSVVFFKISSSIDSTFFAVSITFLTDTAFLALSITFLNGLAFLGLTIKFLAGFTSMVKSIFSTTIFMKFRDRFNLFAFVTSFCYDCFRHSRFSLNVKRFMLEPVEGYAPSVGSLYFKERKKNVK